MSNCCTEFYKIGCVASCDCYNTGIIFEQVGTYTIQYWFSNSSDRFSVNYESDGTTELILPSQIFVPGSPFYFDILQPDNTYFSMTEVITDPITNLSSEIEFKCFWVETFNKIKRDIRNDCAPVACSDCQVDHEFTLDPPAINNSLNPGDVNEFAISFIPESCVQKILLQFITIFHNGTLVDNNVINYTPSDNFIDGFNGTISVPENYQSGDQIVIVIGFLGYSEKGLTNENCYSNSQTTTIIIDVL